MNIQDLTEKENTLLVQIQNVRGLMEEKTQQLKDAGVFETYNQIHKDYVKLAVDGDIEALKRAIFIQWFGVFEPGCFTGIPGTNPWGDGMGLDVEVEKQSLDLAERYYFSENVDDEFKWMVAWYYSLGDYYFEHFLGASALVKALGRYGEEYKLWEDGLPSRKSLENRGQMGGYWLSLLKNR
jgi:hypothetical protein